LCARDVRDRDVLRARQAAPPWRERNCALYEMLATSAAEISSRNSLLRGIAFTPSAAPHHASGLPARQRKSPRQLAPPGARQGFTAGRGFTTPPRAPRPAPVGQSRRDTRSRTSRSAAAGSGPPAPERACGVAPVVRPAHEKAPLTAIPPSGGL